MSLLYCSYFLLLLVIWLSVEKIFSTEPIVAARIVFPIVYFLYYLKKCVGLFFVVVVVNVQTEVQNVKFSNKCSCYIFWLHL